MRTPFRSRFVAILGALVLGASPVMAGSTSAMLTVGVTVVRSCALRTTATAKGAARVDLTCAAGAASTLRRGPDSRSNDAGTTLRLQVPTSAYRGIIDGEVEVATVNF